MNNWISIFNRIKFTINYFDHSSSSVYINNNGNLTFGSFYSAYNPAGLVRTYNQNGDIDLTGPFFQSLGTNGRACSTWISNCRSR